MKNIRILQCGYHRSGNTLFYLITRRLLEKAGLFKISVDKTKLLRYIGLDKDFVWKLEIKRIKNEKLEVTTEVLKDGKDVVETFPIDYIVQNNSILWTHIPPFFVASSKNLISKLSHLFYIYRDGRDAVDSTLFYPSFEKGKAISKEEAYEDPFLFIHNTYNWANHVFSYLCEKRLFIPIKFENMILNLETLLENIAEFLKIPIKDFTIDDFRFELLHRKNPLFFRKGKIGIHREHFSNWHKDIFKKIAGRELVMLGYENIGYYSKFIESNNDFVITGDKTYANDIKELLNHLGKSYRFLAAENPTNLPKDSKIIIASLRSQDLKEEMEKIGKIENVDFWVYPRPYFERKFLGISQDDSNLSFNEKMMIKYRGFYWLLGPIAFKKKIFIYGAHRGGVVIKNFLEKILNKKISAFVDRKLWEKGHINNIPIIPPSELHSVFDGESGIVLSINYKDIKFFLESIGLEELKDFVYLNPRIVEEVLLEN